MKRQQGFISKYKLLLIFIFLPLLIWLPAILIFKSYIPPFELPHSAMSLFVMLLISPVLEEVVFRGLFQDLLLHYLHKPWFCILLLNITFAVTHYRINPDPIYVSSVFASGVIFSYSKLYYAKLTFPIGLHIYYNFVYIVAVCFVLQSSPL